MAIGLAPFAARAGDSGMPSTVALSALIRAKSLGKVLEILFFSSCSSGASLRGYRSPWTILCVQGLCYLIGSRALSLGW